MAEPQAAEAFAKVNLALVVSARRSDGYHPLRSMVQSVSWSDRLKLQAADDDEFRASGMEAGQDNLAWRAVVAAREAAGSTTPMALDLTKEIPVAGGLGGGSADAAAALGMAGARLGLAAVELAELAAVLGADVPFCLTGGLAMMEGRGEQLTTQEPLGGYALAIVVPPVELATAEVYVRWDSLGGPVGEAVPLTGVPPKLRSFDPLRNDLAPAAYDLEPLVSEWRHELARLWDRPVAMSGSGPSLFAFFLDEDEAAGALGAIPAGARGSRAVVPVPQGWRSVPVH